MSLVGEVGHGLWQGGVVRPGGELDGLEAEFEVEGVGVGEVCVEDGGVGRLPFDASGRQSIPELLLQTCTSPSGGCMCSSDGVKQPLLPKICI